MFEEVLFIFQCLPFMINLFISYQCKFLLKTDKENLESLAKPRISPLQFMFEKSHFGQISTYGPTVQSICSHLLKVDSCNVGSDGGKVGSIVYENALSRHPNAVGTLQFPSF